MQLEVLQRSKGDGISEDSPPGELIDWMLARFSGQRMLMTTAFGMEGCALIDMVARRALAFKVVYIDTAFLFPETLDLKDRLAARYPNLEFIGVHPLTPEDQAAEYGDKLWERNPDLCCRLRKVEPMHEVMKDVDVWVAGLRRSQSDTRGRIQVVEWNWQYQVVKISPLAAWDRKQVWAYVQEHEVPYNPLHEHGYPSIGCTHCTQPVAGADVTTYSREGRWNGREKTECGLHGYGI